MRAAAVALAAALAAGCAAERRMTFAEAGFLDEPEPEQAPPPPAAVPAPRRRAVEPPPGPAIDAVLLSFAAEARARRPRHPPGRGFPAAAQAAWLELAGTLDLYLDRPMPATPLLELVRARVTVEAELELDRRRYGTPAPDLTSALEPRLQRLAARARASRALGESLVARRPPPPLRWPLEAAGLSSGFGMRTHPLDGRRRMHWGIDLAAAEGRVVGAAAPGFVVQAGWHAGYGLLVEVRHPGELTSRYSHLSHLLCRAGDEVAPGQPLGLVGRTGRVTGPHLHFEVWQGGQARDPLAWLGGAGRRDDDPRVAVR